MENLGQDDFVAIPASSMRGKTYKDKRREFSNLLSSRLRSSISLFTLKSQIATLHTHLKSLIDFNFPISRFSQKLETPKNETQQERVQKFDGDLDKDKVERAKLSLPQAMKYHAHGDKEVVQALQDCCNKAIDPSLDLDH
ncbi:hypothetical protein QL285_058848 [Trifolium repens]|nr:hypothetical protein QL285_058848 [Trifolium repens]